MLEKRCRQCQTTKLISAFYRHSKMADGHLNYCKECVKSSVRLRRLNEDSVRDQERQRYRGGKKTASLVKYRSSPKGRAVHDASWKARGMVNRAILAGRLIRPSTCEQCEVEAFCEAAHHDYNKPFEIRWLCRRCHRRWDSKEPKTTF